MALRSFISIRQSKLFGPTVVSVGLRVAAVGLSFLFMKAVTHICGAEGWGLYSIAYTIALFAVSVARLGVDTALVKTLGQSVALGQFHRMGAALRQSVVAVLGVSLVLAVVVWAASPFIAVQFGKPTLEAYIRLGALWIPFWAPLFLFTECLRGIGKNVAYQFLQTLLPFLIGILLLVPVLNGALPAFSPDPALMAYGTGLALSAGIAFVVLRRSFHALRIHPLRAKFPIQVLQRTALPILSTYLLVVGLSMTEVLFLGYLAPDAADTGVFSVAVRLSFLMLMPLQAFGSVAAASVAGLHSTGQHAKLADTLRQAGRMVRLATVPLWALLCVCSPWAMGFFGAGFASGWPILILLATNQLFNALCGPIDVLLQMTGQERLYRNLLALGLALNVAANLVLIPHFGLWGAAIAHSITIATWNLVGVWRIYTLYGIWLLRIW